MSGKQDYASLPKWLEDKRDKIVLFDIETDAVIDIGVGTGRYFSEPSTRITLTCWKRLGDDEVKTDIDPQCKEFLADVKEGDILVAHNAIFDLIGVGFKPSFKGLFVCTSAICRSINIPASLKNACDQMNEVHQKADLPETLRASIERDYAGDSLFDATEEQWQEFIDYGKKDVLAMEELFCRIVNYIEEDELKAIDAHLRTNMRGIPFDREGLKTEGDRIRKEQLELALQFKEEFGFEPTQTIPLVAWMSKQNNMHIPSAAKKELEQIYHKVDDKTRRALDIRNKVSKHTAAKTVKIRERLDAGDAKPARLRDAFLFAGAVTGRWKSKGANMQNNERGGLIKQTVIAPPGQNLYVGDFKQVELRVALWVTGEQQALRLLHGDPNYDEKKHGKKPDFYEETASAVFGTPAKKVTKQQRFFGKQLVLGANYGMGPSKFVLLCKNNGSDITEDEAKEMIGKYRQERNRLAGSWRSLDTACKQAMHNPGEKVVPRGTRGVWALFDEGSGELLVRLPTRRLIRYAEACFVQSKYGDEQIQYVDTGEYVGRNFAKKFLSHGGLVLENICQAISRDLLCRAMIRFEETFDGEREGVVGHVHDELIAQVDKSRDKQMLDDLLVPPSMREIAGDESKLLLDIDSHLVQRWGDAK